MAEANRETREYTGWDNRLAVAPSVLDGKTGTATARTPCNSETFNFGWSSIAPATLARWCHKGHIVYVVSGDLIIEHEDGVRYVVKPGVSYHVGDDQESPHRALSETGTTLFVLD